MHERAQLIGLVLSRMLACEIASSAYANSFSLMNERPR